MKSLIKNSNNISILFFFMIFICIFDLINGYYKVIYGNIVYYSAIIKMLFFIYVYIKFPFKIKLNYYLNLLILLIFIFLSLLMQLFLNYFYYNDFYRLIKLIYPLFLAIFISDIKDKIIILSLKIIYFIYSFSILILSLLKINYSTYRYLNTSKGLFYSGNEISILLLITLPFFIYSFSRKKFILKFIISFIYSIYIAILVGTRTIFIGTLLTYILYFYFFYKNKKNKKILSIFVIVFIITILIYFKNNIYNLLIKRIVLNMNRIGTKNILYAIFEKRYIYFIKNLKLLFKNPFIIFSGYGYQNTINIFKNTIENDLFDLFFQYGILVTFSYYYLLIYYFNKKIKIVKKLKKHLNSANISKVSFLYYNLFFISSFFYIITSIILGHTIFSGVIGISWGLIFSRFIK